MSQTLDLPTMENPKHPDLVRQATVYVEMRDKFLSAQRQFKVEKDALLMLMREHQLSRYVDPEDDLLIERENGHDSIKVKKLSEQKEK